VTQFNKLYERVSAILLGEWDPIGIRDVPNAGDEYSSYATPIAKMIIARKSTFDLSNYLFRIEIDEMGLNGDKGRARSVAEKLKQLEECI